MATGAVCDRPIKQTRVWTYPIIIAFWAFHYCILGILGILGISEFCLIEAHIFLIPNLREREISRPVAFQAFFFDT
ncbi:MAG: hypothetical protein KA368_04615, partial [Acidobacteria bacterium]|nr:hypothetical protein [Acidobacteriota bacterium]